MHQPELHESAKKTWELGGCLVLPAAIWEVGLPVFLHVVGLSLRRIRKSYAALLQCLRGSLHPAWLPSLRNVGIWLLHVMNCTGKTLSNALSRL